MLPDHIIYEELERRKRRKTSIEDSLAYVEISREMPYWPEENVEDEQDRDENQRDIIIIKM